MNKSRKEYPILKKISNFCPPYLPRIYVIIILRQTEKEEEKEVLDQVRSRYRVKRICVEKKSIFCV